MSPIDLDRLLDRFRPDRRNFLRTLILGTAYATPLVTSFSMDGLGLDAALGQSICGSNLAPNTSTLNIVKTASPDPALAGAELTYTVTVTNCTAGPAPDVRVVDGLPSGATFVSSRQSGGTTMFAITEPPVGSEGAPWEATAAALPAGESVEFEIVVQVNP